LLFSSSQPASQRLALSGWREMRGRNFAEFPRRLQIEFQPSGKTCRKIELRMVKGKLIPAKCLKKGV
jgi:hypothetical protein